MESIYAGWISLYFSYDCSRAGIHYNRVDKMTSEGILKLKQHEGLRLQAYRCPAGVLTIGWGHTAGVKEGQTITIEDAEYLLSEDINDAEIGARSLFDNWFDFSPVRQDAVVKRRGFRAADCRFPCQGNVFLLRIF